MIPRGSADRLLEEARKVEQVLVAELAADLLHPVPGVAEQVAGLFHLEVDEVIDGAAPRLLLEQGAIVGRGEVTHLGQVSQGERPMEVLLHEPD